MVLLRRPPGSQRGQASSSRPCDVGRFGAICDQQKWSDRGWRCWVKTCPYKLGYLGGLNLLTYLAFTIKSWDKPSTLCFWVGFWASSWLVTVVCHVSWGAQESRRSWPLIEEAKNAGRVKWAQWWKWRVDVGNRWDIWYIILLSNYIMYTYEHMYISLIHNIYASQRLILLESPRKNVKEKIAKSNWFPTIR